MKVIQPKTVYPVLKYRVKKPYQERTIIKQNNFVKGPIVQINPVKKVNLCKSSRVKQPIKYIFEKCPTVINNNYSNVVNNNTHNVTNNYCSIFSYELIPNTGLTTNNGIVIYSDENSITFQVYVNSILDHSYTLRRDDFYIKYNYQEILIYSFANQIPFIISSKDKFVNFPGLSTSQIVEKIIKA